MNPYVGKLCEIAEKDSRLILGLMSGTSLDGLDMALCRISGSGPDTRLTLEEFTTVAYQEDLRREVQKVFSKPQVDFQLLCILNAHLGRLHARLILDTLAGWTVLPGQVDLVASHGQTVYHAPSPAHRQAGYPNATLQIGDGDHIAVQTGIITISDFRQKHIAAGGEGAPLAVYGDYLLFSHPSENRILLNLGGIANFTFLPGNRDPDGVFTTDIGPANTLMDAWCREYFGLPFDPDGNIGRKGQSNGLLLTRLLDDPFFRQPFPKSTGPELFNMDYLARAREETGTQDLPPEDVLATLAHLTAQSVADALLPSLPPGKNNAVYVSGGGANNPFLLELIGRRVPSLKPLSALGFPGDAKEAILFALLANETVAAPRPALNGRERLPAISLGKISFPG